MTDASDLSGELRETIQQAFTEGYGVVYSIQKSGEIEPHIVEKSPEHSTYPFFDQSRNTNLYVKGTAEPLEIDVTQSEKKEQLELIKTEQWRFYLRYIGFKKALNRKEGLDIMHYGLGIMASIGYIMFFMVLIWG